ncbi:MAG: cell division protein FtsQ/DivIB [Candidatus Dojkabacteria bacterium]
MFGRNKEPKIDYKKQRQKALLKDRAGDVVGWVSKIKKYIFITIGLVILAGVIVLFNNDQLFKVQDIEVIGTTRVDTKEVLALLDSYKGKNILKVRSTEIEGLIKSKYSEVLNVYVSKDISGIIKLDIVESTPVVVVISKDSITLLNNRAMVVGSLNPPKLDLSETETLALQGKLTSDSLVVKKRFEDDPENTTEGITWAKATADQKNRYVQAYQNEANIKIDDYFNQSKDIVAQSVYNDLVKLLDRQGLKNDIEGSSIEFVLKIQELILKIPLVVTSIEYRTGDTFIFITDSGKQLYFFPRRPYLDQIRDLNVLITSGEYNNLSIIDFRTEKYSGI